MAHSAALPDGNNRSEFETLDEKGSTPMQLPGESIHHVHLTEEKATLFITLYAKAMDNRSKRPILGDKTADELVSSLAYDFHKLKGVSNNHLGVLRAKQFDD